MMTVHVIRIHWITLCVAVFIVHTLARWHYEVFLHMCDPRPLGHQESRLSYEL